MQALPLFEGVRPAHQRRRALPYRMPPQEVAAGVVMLPPHDTTRTRVRDVDVDMDDCGGGDVASSSSSHNDPLAAQRRGANHYDRYALPKTLYPRLARMSIVEPARCLVYIEHGMLARLPACLPTISEAVIGELLDQLHCSLARGRLAAITVAFWWLVTEIACLENMVVLSEHQHGNKEHADELICAMRKIVNTVRCSSFETFNTWPCIVPDFYALARRIIVEEDDELRARWAGVRIYEKVPRELKGADLDSAMLGGERGGKGGAKSSSAGAKSNTKSSAAAKATTDKTSGPSTAATNNNNNNNVDGASHLRVKYQ